MSDTGKPPGAMISAEREMTLAEWVGRLYEGHAARLELAALERDLAAANEMCMSAYGSTASEVLAENRRLAAEHTQVHEVNAGLLRDLAALRQRLTEIGNHWADVQTEYAAGHGLEGSAAPRLAAALEADHE